MSAAKPPGPSPKSKANSVFLESHLDEVIYETAFAVKVFLGKL